MNAAQKQKCQPILPIECSGRMFLLPHFQLKSINISTILICGLKTSIHMCVVFSGLGFGIYIVNVEETEWLVNKFISHTIFTDFYGHSTYVWKSISSTLNFMKTHGINSTT